MTPEAVVGCAIITPSCRPLVSIIPLLIRVTLVLLILYGPEVTSVQITVEPEVAPLLGTSHEAIAPELYKLSNVTVVVNDKILLVVFKHAVPCRPARFTNSEHATHA